MNRNWHEIDRLRERIWIAIAWRLPRGLAYWAAIRVNTAVTADPRYADKPVHEVSVLDATANWN